VQQRLPSLLNPPLTFAHRGARANAPENTIEAFSLGLKLGAAGLESDVWLTADGVAVLDHDGIVKKGLRRKPIADVLRADLPTHIPTLDELFANCGTGYELSLDLKDPAAAGAVIEVANARDPSMIFRLWLCEPKLERAIELRKNFEGVKILQSTRLEKLKEGPERHANTLAQHGIDGINFHRTDWNGGLIALFHRFGLIAFGWDLQFEHDLRPAFRMGLDGVYSDHVDVMTDAFNDEIGHF
jgi:glycerophosphoryl diester phosphodiesterase